jgi:hypothetical protein
MPPKRYKKLSLNVVRNQSDSFFLLKIPLIIPQENDVMPQIKLPVITPQRIVLFKFGAASNLGPKKWIESITAVIKGIALVAKIIRGNFQAGPSALIKKLNRAIVLTYPKKLNIEIALEVDILTYK